MPREERTEKATPRHRRRAREEGQVARSADVGGSLVLAAGLFTLSIFGSHIASSVAGSFRAIFADIANPSQVTTAGALEQLMHVVLFTVGLAVAPVAGACMLTGVAAGAAQVGLRPSPKALRVDFKRINPAHGARNLFGPNAAFEAVKAIAKVSVVGAVVGLTLIPSLRNTAATVGIPPAALGAMFGHKALGIAQHATFAYLLIAAIDYGWQRRRNERHMRMTKQEVKDELRQHGVSSEIKAAQRRRRAQQARARMMAAVPTADVVVTNPTHFAVALRYDGSRTAPEVIAKGQDLIAAQIRKVAAEHGVPIVPDPPLARALHASTEIGQMIPQELYAAVARVLAYVFRVARRRGVAAAAGSSR